MELTEQARAAYGNAKRIWEKLVQQEPQEFQHHSELASACHQLARLHIAENEFREATSLLSREKQVRDRLAETRPDLLDNQIGRVYFLQLVGLLHQQQGRRAERDEAMRDAIELCVSLRNKFPEEPIVHLISFELCVNQSLRSLHGGDPQDAEAKLELALSSWRELSGHDHQMPGCQQKLALAFSSFSNLEVGRGDYERAKEYLDRAIGINAPLAELHPHLPVIRGQLGYIYNQRAHLPNNSPKEAITWYTKSIETYEDLVARKLATTVDGELLQKSYLGRAKSHEELGMEAEAIADRKRAADLNSQNLRKLWDSPAFRPGPIGL